MFEVFRARFRTTTVAVAASFFLAAAPYICFGLFGIDLTLLIAETPLVSASAPVLKIGVGRIVPVAYFDDDGKAVGFAVDVINEAARREGVPVTWMRLVKGVGEDLQSGTIDLLSAGMATEERKRDFYVSEPWWSQELALLTREGSKQPMKRLGLQQVYVEFARAYYNPATFVIDAQNTNAAVAIEAKAVCKGTLDGALITHGELHDLFLNRPEECSGVRLQSIDTAIKYGLSIIARKSDEAVAKRLRKRVDDLIVDGTLLRLAAAHPPISLAGAVDLEERIRHRYHNRIWKMAGCILVLLVIFLVWFLRDKHRDLTRTRRSESALRTLHGELRKAHDALSQANAHMTLALDSGESGAWSWNIDSRELTWNETYYRLLGVNPTIKPSPRLASSFESSIAFRNRSCLPV